MLAVAGLSVNAMAQQADPTEKYSVATNSFWSNWFISADFSYGAFYSNEEQGMNPKLSKSPFKGFRNNIGASVAIGKWFTPGFGLRTKATGIWGRNVQSDNKKTNAVKFWNISEQAMFNLSNMFCGYSDTRVWNFIPYAMTVSAGIVNTWKLSKHFLLNLDLGYTFAPDYDAFRPANGAVAANYGDGMKNCDRFFTAEIGLTYNLGKTGWNKTPDVEAIKALSQGQIDALNAQLSDAQAEKLLLLFLYSSTSVRLRLLLRRICRTLLTWQRLLRTTTLRSLLLVTLTARLVMLTTTRRCLRSVLTPLLTSSLRWV